MEENGFNSKLTLQRHDVATRALDHLGDHVVDEAVLVPDALFLEGLLVLRIVDLLEDVLEAAVVLLEDGVLGAHVQRQALVEGELEAGVREARDALVGVVLGLRDAAAALELVDLDLLGLAALGCVHHRQLPGAGKHGVLRPVLVAEGVPPDDDGLLPARHQPRDPRDHNRLPEYRAA